MKDVKSRFENMQNKRPFHSTYLNFVRTIEHQGFTKDTIRRWFGKLVDPDDYDPREKRDILKELYKHSEKPLRRPDSGAKSASKRNSKTKTSDSPSLSNAKSPGV